MMVVDALPPYRLARSAPKGSSIDFAGLNEPGLADERSDCSFQAISVR